MLCTHTVNYVWPIISPKPLCSKCHSFAKILKVPPLSLYVTVLEKRDHLATNIIFELCIPSESGHCELQNGS